MKRGVEVGSIPLLLIVKKKAGGRLLKSSIRCQDMLAQSQKQTFPWNSQAGVNRARVNGVIKVKGNIRHDVEQPAEEEGSSKLQQQQVRRRSCVLSKDQTGAAPFTPLFKHEVAFCLLLSRRFYIIGVLHCCLISNFLPLSNCKP